MKSPLFLSAYVLSLGFLASSAFSAPADQPGHQSPAPGTTSPARDPIPGYKWT